MKTEILKAAYACGAGGEKTYALVLPTKNETSGETVAVGSGIGSGTGDGATDDEGVNAAKAEPAPPSDGQNNRAHSSPEWSI